MSPLTKCKLRIVWLSGPGILFFVALETIRGVVAGVFEWYGRMHDEWTELRHLEKDAFGEGGGK